MRDWKYLKIDIEERWEWIAEKLLALRGWLNSQNPMIMTAIAGIFVFVLVAIAISRSGNDKELTADRSKKAWFYDLNTGELFTAKSDKIPPIKAPSGALANGEPAGVKAYVFSYVYEPNESERFIGYLEKFTPEGKSYISSFQKSRDSVTKESMRQLSKNRLIRRVSDKQWFSGDSREGQAIVAEIFSRNKPYSHHYLPR